MWDQGVVRFDRDRNIYTHYQADSNNPNSLSNNNIFDLRFDSRGWLWVATTAGLNKFDLETKTWKQYHADPTTPNALAGDWISGVAIDRHGNLWLAAYGTGLYRFNPTSEAFTRYQHNDADPNSLANNNLNFVMVSDDGMIWIGGDSSVSRFDPNTEKAVNFTPERNSIKSILMNINSDSNGTILIVDDLPASMTSAHVRRNNVAEMISK